MKITAIVVLLSALCVAADAPAPPKLTDTQKLALTRLQLQASVAQQQMADARNRLAQANAEWNRLQAEYCAGGKVTENRGDLECSPKPKDNEPKK